ncbi:MAG: hypothetical protein Fues2KO_52910 [Fuerstiella sp.]
MGNWPQEQNVDLFTTPACDLKPLGYARHKWIPYRPGNKPVSPPTMYRWAKKGVYGEKLMTLQTPGGTVTSEAACRDFLNRVHKARTAAETNDVIDASDDELQKAGLA